MADESIWSQLGSVVGIGTGSLDLQLVKTSFAPGETVHGRLWLKLSRPTEAKRLVVGVAATRRRDVVSTDSWGRRSTEQRTETVHRQELELDGKRIYHDQAYDVHLPLPSKNAAPELPQGTLGDVAKLIGFVANLVTTPVAWHVFAFVDVPWKANISTRVPITLQT